MSVVVDVQPGCIGDAGESERSAGQNGELYKPHPVGVFQPESPVVVALCCLADYFGISGSSRKTSLLHPEERKMMHAAAMAARCCFSI